MCLVLVLSILIITIVKFINYPTPRPVLSIYRQPDKWYYIKLGIGYLFLKLRKEIHKLKSARSGKDSSNGRIKYQSIIEKLGSPQKLSYYPKSADSAYFNASNSNGYYFICGITIRPFGIASGFLLLKVPGIGFLESLKLPDTMLFQDEVEKSLMLHGSEGLNFTSINPFKKWKISYNGKLKNKDDSRKIYDVAVNVSWTSNLKHFDLDWDIDPLMMARSVAKEPWNRDLFETLKVMHQVHHEQYGTIKGSILINGETHKIKLNSQRIHICGYKQLWKKVHRYVMHTMNLEDGTRITAAILSIPITFSSKYYGYIYKPNGQLVAITNCSLILHEHGERGYPPADYSFTIKAGLHFHANAGGNSYQIEVEVLESTEFYVGWQWETKVVECLSKYRVNGASGWGAAEWHYRHTGGRPKHFSYQDPDWRRTIKA